MNGATGNINQEIPAIEHRPPALLATLKWVTISIFWLLPCTTKAQSATNYTVNANIIYHFTKYIDWPDARKEGDFVIGVVGESPLYDELKKMMAGKTAGRQRIVVEELTVLQVSSKYHIVFITEEESRSLKKIAAKTAGSSVLLVSEEDGLAQKGSCINFTIVSEHLVLEINKENIEQRHLNIAGDLLRLGKIVQ